MFRGVLQDLWNVYQEKVTYVNPVKQAIAERKDEWNEDHIAFRTFKGTALDAKALASLFEIFGYEKQDVYFFAEKKLDAFWLKPPVSANEPQKNCLPKIFISELRLEDFPSEVNEVIRKYTDTQKVLPFDSIRKSFAAGKYSEVRSGVFQVLNSIPWQRPSYQDYQFLTQHSEYAAWTLLFGSIPNHFTVSVHLMNSFENLTEFSEHVETQLNIPLNKSGGVIKGNPEVLLEQFSTMASKIPYLFQEGLYEVPYAFIEFAFRFKLENQPEKGLWENYYQGFVMNNADKIFESTNSKPA